MRSRKGIEEDVARAISKISNAEWIQGRIEEVRHQCMQISDKERTRKRWSNRKKQYYKAKCLASLDEREVRRKKEEGDLRANFQKLWEEQERNREENGEKSELQAMVSHNENVS